MRDKETAKRSFQHGAPTTSQVAAHFLLAESAMDQTALCCNPTPPSCWMFSMT